VQKSLLADQPMVRSYYLADCDWTPRNQNPAWKATMHSSLAGDGRS